MVKNRFGRVIAITSTHGNMIAGRPWFNIAKVSQTVFIRNLATVKEFARAGITFNCIAPGAILIPDTGWGDLLKENPEKYEELISKLPMGRLGNPSEIAKVVLFSASTEASLINGSVITVDGGESNQSTAL